MVGADQGIDAAGAGDQGVFRGGGGVEAGRQREAFQAGRAFVEFEFHIVQGVGRVIDDGGGVEYAAAFDLPVEHQIGAVPFRAEQLEILVAVDQGVGAVAAAGQGDGVAVDDRGRVEVAVGGQ